MDALQDDVTSHARPISGITCKGESGTDISRKAIINAACWREHGVKQIQSAAVISSAVLLQDLSCALRIFCQYIYLFIKL